MKTTKIALLPLFIFTLMSFSFLQEEVVSQISSAIRAGNARQLSAYFHATVDLTVQDIDGTYSKAQSEMIIKDFFDKNQAAGFSISHQGSSRDASHFYIGNYTTKTNKQFRIYFLLKSYSGNFLIQQFQVQLQ